MDHYADDLAAVIEALDLDDITAVGFSTGAAKWRATLAATVPTRSRKPH